MFLHHSVPLHFRTVIFTKCYVVFGPGLFQPVFLHSSVYRPYLNTSSSPRPSRGGTSTLCQGRRRVHRRVLTSLPAGTEGRRARERVPRPLWERTYIVTNRFLRPYRPRTGVVESTSDIPFFRRSGPESSAFLRRKDQQIPCSLRWDTVVQ